MLVIPLLVVTALALNNGVARTPAMGYNTWNDFRCSGITAAHVEAVADKFIAYGLDKVGYVYVNIDDCWSVGRTSNGTLIANQTAFPQGISAVADYAHNLGLKFGIYTDRGTKTCAGRPGSGGHESIDADTFALWGVDYLKEDSCYASDDHDVAFHEYGLMRDALNKTGRHIYFSLCGWNAWYAPVGYSLGNSWRIGGDVNGWESVYNSIRINMALAPYARPGGWNDPDMLVGSSPHAAVSNTPAQSRTQFSLWSIMAAPLLIGSNILNMTTWDLETYKNTEVIAVDQDSLGKQGTVIWETCPTVELDVLYERARTKKFAAVPSCQQIWAKPLASGAVAMGFVNYDLLVSKNITCDAACFAKAGLHGTASVRDLWSHTNLGDFSSFSAVIDRNGASRTLLFTPKSL